MASASSQPSVRPNQHSASEEQISTSAETDGLSHRRQRRPSTTRSAISEDSQTVYLNTPSPSTLSPREKDSQTKQEVETSSQATPEPRKCWICFADETEDTPTSSDWRSPCPCALTAHETCLLDWVADLEAPNRRKQASGAKIQCPQCKADIRIARPMSPVIWGVAAVKRIINKVVWPGAILTVGTAFWSGCFLYGASTVYLIFGRLDANRLLRPNAFESVRLKWAIGLPLVPLALISSRTTLADNYLPVLPILFFATALPSDIPDRKNLWPPSAAMTLATLPYLRAAYNATYKQLFAEREKRWLQEIQPRAAGNGEDGTTNQPEPEEGFGNQDGEGFGNLGLNIEVDVEIVEEEIEEIPPQPEIPAANPIADNQQQNDQPQNRAPPQPAARQPPQHDHQPLDLILPTSRIAETVLGALVFPAVSATMGEILKSVLPATWTMLPRWFPFQRETGLMQSRWGRSIVGGCLFVVLKDALMVYTRYRLAQDHRKRSVLNYDRGIGRGR